MSIEITLPKPQPKQVVALKAKKKHICFGGARGGGKSFFIRLKSTMLCLKHKGITCMIVRKTYPELIANHVEPLKQLTKVNSKDAIAKYTKSDKTFTFLNGSRILLRYCDREDDVDRFQGTECDVLFLDEATQFSEMQMKKLSACVRGVNDFPKHVIYTCNPGGVGMNYIKRIFIDRKFEENEDPNEYEFIQSLVYDNKVLMKSNPDYVKQLEALPPKLREAWLGGRWDVFQGAYFEEFRSTPDPQMCHEVGITTEEALITRRFTHVIEPFDIPPDWKIYRSYDWGYGKPFSCGWWAVNYDGVAFRILELYGCTKTPNEGVKWSNDKQFSTIAEIEREHPYLRGKFIQGVADPSIWDGSHGISAADTADKHGVYFTPGINDRVPGWMQVRERLKFDENGYPRMYFFSNCNAVIRCMPLMMFDEHKPEDLCSDMEDHCLDEVRYFCMLNPIAPSVVNEIPNIISDPLNQFSMQKPIAQIRKI